MSRNSPPRQPMRKVSLAEETRRAKARYLAAINTTDNCGRFWPLVELARRLREWEQAADAEVRALRASIAACDA